MPAKPIYKRVLLKLSGEALMGDGYGGIAPDVISRIAKEVLEIVRLGVQVAIVVGGGNIFRGSVLSQLGLDRITGDHMGMLATVMNALAMREIFETAGMSTRILSAIPMSGMVDHFDRRKAIHHLTEGRVVICAAGTGNPLVTTDSAASLRAVEMKADVVLKATNVDGVYSADPRTNPDAELYSRITYKEVLNKELAVMDLGAFCQCRDHDMILRVFNINKSGALLRVVIGEEEGTLVVKGES